MERINKAQRMTNQAFQKAGKQPYQPGMERQNSTMPVEGGAIAARQARLQAANPTRFGGTPPDSFNGQMMQKNPMQLEGRMNQEERRMINQGMATAPAGANFQGRPQQPMQPKVPMQSPTQGDITPDWRGATQSPFSGIPTQKLPQMLPNGQPRDPADPNIYGSGNMQTLIGWNQNHDPNWGSQFGIPGGIHGLMNNPRLQPYGGMRSQTRSPGIGMNGQRIQY